MDIDKSPGVAGITLGNVAGRAHGAAAADKAIIDANAMRGGVARKQVNE